MKIRNQNQFAELPAVKKTRTIFDKNWEVKDTFNVSELIPVDIEEVLPGDTHEMDITALIRTSTAALKPVLDNAKVNIYAFFVPDRIVWDHTKEFHGENRTDEWDQKTTYTIPQITAPAGGWGELTLADHFGLRPKIANQSVSHIPFRKYVRIFNEWFRDQNNQKPLMDKTDDSTTTGTNGTDQITSTITGGAVAKVNKFPDYFTTALPGPQKGAPVQIGTINSQNIGVEISAKQLTANNNEPLQFVQVLNNAPIQTNSNASFFNVGNVNGALTAGDASKMVAYKDGLVGVIPAGAIDAITIRDFRLAAATQQVLELDARSGTRYVEMIEAQFGVISDDARQQRPEFLGATENVLNNIEVAQTSEGTQTSPQANLSAFSKTGINNELFKKSFTEHGHIMILACVRTNHTYGQGTERQWFRKTRLDFHLPITENIGEQAIYNREIFTQGTAADAEVFGYQEQRADYKYKPSKIKGKFRVDATDSLAVWHYGDNFKTLPVLGQEFIQETPINMDRTLAIDSTKQPQLLADFWIKNKCTRIMQPHSEPGMSKI